MKTFKEFLFEMPLRLHSGLSKKDDGKENTIIRDFYRSKKAQYKSLGDYNDQYEHKYRPAREGVPEIHTLIDKKSGDPHLHVEMGDTEHGKQITSLHGHVDNKVGAHHFYRHLIHKHGFRLRSDEAQTIGGSKVWQKLHAMPDVKVSHIDENGNKLKLHTDDWDKNSFNVRTTNPDHKNKEYINSTFIAEK